MNILLHIIICWVLIFYAICKLTLCICELLPPRLIPIKVSFLTHDMTSAGLVLVITFLIFSTYTLLHGLSILHYLPYKIIKYFQNITINYIIYLTLGVMLIIFYSLVLFTDLNISKNEKHRASYEIIGLGGGVLFIASVLILSIYIKFINQGYNLIIFFEFLASFILIIIFILIVVKAYSRKEVKEQSIGYYIISISAIPLAFI